MTQGEFKAWFEGFSENIKGAPTQKQWARIQERVSQIDGHELTTKVIHEWYPRYWYTYTPCLTAGVTTTTIANKLTTATNTASFLGQMGATEARALS